MNSIETMEFIVKLIGKNNKNQLEKFLEKTIKNRNRTKFLQYFNNNKILFRN